MLGAIRLARSPESGKATLKNQIAAELSVVLGMNPALKVVKIADGAEDNWTYLSELVPSAPEIIDYFHACEKLNEVLGAAYGEGTREARLRFEDRKEALRDDENGVTKVISTLARLSTKYPNKASITGALNYFKKHRQRMRYAHFKSLGFPIGSGVLLRLRARLWSRSASS